MTRRPMTCDEVLAQLLAYLDRELDDAACAELAQHLEGCRACFSRAEFERALKSLVRDTGDMTAPAGLRARIKDLIEKF